MYGRSLSLNAETKENKEPTERGARVTLRQKNSGSARCGPRMTKGKKIKTDESILKSQFHSPLCRAGLHKFKAVHNALPNTRHKVAHPSTDNQKQ
jgi:hypothetical protein